MMQREVDPSITFNTTDEALYEIDTRDRPSTPRLSPYSACGIGQSTRSSAVAASRH